MKNQHVQDVICKRLIAEAEIAALAERVSLINNFTYSFNISFHCFAIELDMDRKGNVAKWRTLSNLELKQKQINTRNYYKFCINYVWPYGIDDDDAAWE